MKQVEVFLKHILDEANFLIKETQGIEFKKLVKNEVLKRACSRSLEIIGEAVKNVPDDFKNEHNVIEWKKLAGLRDKIIHYNFGVNWDILWDVLVNHIPKLKQQIEDMLKEINE